MPALELNTSSRGQCQVSLVGAAASTAERGVPSEGTQVDTLMTVQSRTLMVTQPPVSLGCFFQCPLLWANGRILSVKVGKRNSGKMSANTVFLQEMSWLLFLLLVVIVDDVVHGCFCRGMVGIM